MLPDKFQLARAGLYYTGMEDHEGKGENDVGGRRRRMMMEEGGGRRRE